MNPTKQVSKSYWNIWHPDHGVWGLFCCVRGSKESSEQLCRDLRKRGVSCYPVEVNITMTPVKKKPPARAGKGGCKQ